MTYAQLIQELLALPPERLGDTVTVYSAAADEFYAAEFQIFVESANSTLDDGHAYLEF